MNAPVARATRTLDYVLRRSTRKLLVALFYPRFRHDPGMLGLHSGLLLTNGLAQRVLRLNGKAPFPVHFTSRVTSPGSVNLGVGVARYLAISGGCYIQAANGVTIGDHTMIAPGVKIISANHDSDQRSEHVQTAPITIGANCWLGANVVVLPGRAIGSGTIVGAGSVVASDLPDDCTAFGVPARVRQTGGQ